MACRDYPRGRGASPWDRSCQSFGQPRGRGGRPAYSNGHGKSWRSRRVSEETIEEYNTSLTRRKLYLHALDHRTTEQTIRTYFSKFGPVVEVIVFRYRPSGISRCTGLLTFLNETGVKKALRNPTGEEGRNTHHKIDGTRIIVQTCPAIDKDDGPSILPGFLSMNLVELARDSSLATDRSRPTEHADADAWLGRQLEAYFSELCGDRDVRATIYPQSRGGPTNSPFATGRRASVRFFAEPKSGSELALVKIRGREVVIDGKYEIGQIRLQLTYRRRKDGARAEHVQGEMKQCEENIRNTSMSRPAYGKI